MITDELRSEIWQARLEAARLECYYETLADTADNAKTAALLRTISTGCGDIEIELDELRNSCDSHDANDGEIRARLIQLKRDGLRKTAKAVGAAQRSEEESL